MAFNEILVGRLNRWAQKLLVIKNTALRSLSPDLQAVLPIFQGVEERYLQGWNRFMVTVTVNAVAAQFGSFELRNPSNSALVAVIEKINILPGATSLARVLIAAISTDFGTGAPNNGTRLDPRGNPGSGMSLTSGTNATLLGQAVFRELATTTFPETPFIVTANQELTVLPGDACILQLELANTQCSFAIMWRERPLESSELT